MKPLILVDCDDVLSDFTNQILNYISDKRKKQITLRQLISEFEDREEKLHHSKIDSKNIDIFDLLDFSERKDAREYCSIKGFCKNMSILPFAKKAMNLLREFSDVYCVTSPFESYYWTSERMEWLKSNIGFKKKEVCLFSTKELVFGDVFIDDHVENLEKWQKRHPNGLAIRFPVFDIDVDSNVYEKEWTKIISQVKEKLNV